MVSFPPCKINLGLYILSKRSDGYHSISTCFYPVPWTDVLEILPSEKVSFTQTGLKLSGRLEENLCFRAHDLLMKDFDLPPLQIHLHKVIPAGAGLGGGSSDAAHTLASINRVARLGLSTVQLLPYAEALGSDCSFFLHDKPAIGSERGNRLDPISVNLKGYFMVIVYPGIPISSAEAYADVTPHPSAVDLPSLLSGPVHGWRHQLLNDFEESIFKRYPALGRIKDALYQDGALFVSLSGSGSSVFGIFGTEVDAKDYGKGSINWSGWL